MAIPKYPKSADDKLEVARRLILLREFLTEERFSKQGREGASGDYFDKPTVRFGIRDAIEHLFPGGGDCDPAGGDAWLFMVLARAARSCGHRLDFHRGCGGDESTALDDFCARPTTTFQDVRVIFDRAVLDAQV